MGRSWIQENTVSDRKYCRDGSVSICRISKSDDRGIWRVQKEERLILLSARKEVRRLQYDELLPRFREAGSLAFISDYLAIDAVDYFIDKESGYLRIYR